MLHLALSLLGSFQVTLDGQLVTDFKSDKVRALLAYLAVEADRPHRRELLAALLWPEMPDRFARGNLRNILANLRTAIGDRHASPPLLLISRETLQFNAASDHWLDVVAFDRLVAADETQSAAAQRLEEALTYYRGEFLEGFSLDDSVPFEEWALYTRERLARQRSSALYRLAAILEKRGEYHRAQAYARRQIELEPWDETAHQQLMRALALAGQRGAALAHFETCRRLLAEELGVEPGAATTRLYERIRDGTLSVPAPSPAPAAAPRAEQPAFLAVPEPPKVEPAVFVARESELAQLESFLGPALVGRGRVVFVTGEAGSGKTALLQAFQRFLQARYPDLVVGGGDCNAYTGIGDPYLPFREILELLTGDVEAKWAAGAISREHARRLWHTLPVAVQALVETGPDLIDTFVLRAALLQRALSYAPSPPREPWLVRLNELLQRKPASSAGALAPQQSDLFEQYTRVLQAVAQRRTLLLTLDDLQWADLGSISLLFHLGRRLAGSRILIVGAYRPEEVAIGRDGERHPLERVVNEFQRDFGDVTVDLGRAERRDFVEALLDHAPNRLDDTFREMLFRQTRGHPLFTIELLRGLQERGDLLQDSQGRWVAGPALDWESLPARVEAVIAERIGRLAQPLRAALRVASVEGETFTAEVVARVRSSDEQEMLEHLSGELDRRHRLIRAQSIQRVDGQLLSRYRFRHILFQRYLYGSLDEVERVHLHEQVGTALEELHRAQDETTAGTDIAPQLALHFQKASSKEKAIHYLHMAGERAVRLSAYHEAIAHLTQGLDLLMTLPDSPERQQQELALQLSLGTAWIDTTAPEREKAYVRAIELCRQMGQVSQLSRALGLGGLAVLYYVRAEYQKARELAEEALHLAQQAGDVQLIALGHWYLGFILFGLGEYVSARAHLAHTIDCYEPRKHQTFVSLRGSDPGPSALAYDACCLWCLGYPRQALARSQEALALARELDHALSLADVLYYAGCLVNEMRRDAAALKQDAQELIDLLNKLGSRAWLASGTYFRGAAMVMSGQIQEGMVQVREGMTSSQARGVSAYLPGWMRSLAEAQAKAGQLEEALATVSEGLRLVNETGERHWEAELHRLRAGLLLMQGDPASAEASLKQAIEVARRQSARSWELRATTDLARLWQRQGKMEAARKVLAEIYAWFTEGFDTPDLKEARALLEELSHSR